MQLPYGLPPMQGTALGNQLRSSLAGADTAPALEKASVPTTLSDALKVFMATPTVIFATSMIASCAGWRLRLATEGAPLLPLDACVFVIASAAWVIQEWAIHKYLLHSQLDWLGSRIHVGHHTRPYHQVVVDGVEIVAPFMLVTAGLLWALLKDWGLGTVLSACVGYHLTGLISYQLIHFLVHTKWVPNNRYMRDVRRHHMLHHLRSHDHWFAFSAPQMDWMMGTAPAHPSDVPLKTMIQSSKTSGSIPAVHASEQLAGDKLVAAAHSVSGSPS